MIQRMSRWGLCAVLAGLAAGAGVVRAGPCGAGGCAAGGYGVGGFARGNPGMVYYGSEFGWFNEAWLFPDGGYTLYPGQAGSCVPSHSDYSKVYWTVPPAVNAQRVLNKLQTLGIPLVEPETMYLGKNPHGLDNVKLPLPRGWTTKEPEKISEKPKELDKPKEIEKPKETDKLKLPEKVKPKPKDTDDDL